MAAQSARAAAQAEEADPEIMLIFVEDARDVLNMVRKEFSAYRQNPDNIAPLLEMRRGYHTIKGSGRMVGATDVAELAWAVENMLNKVRDGKIEVSQDSIPRCWSAPRMKSPAWWTPSRAARRWGDVEALGATGLELRPGWGTGNVDLVRCRGRRRRKPGRRWRNPRVPYRKSTALCSRFFFFFQRGQRASRYPAHRGRPLPPGRHLPGIGPAVPFHARCSAMPVRSVST